MNIIFAGAIIFSVIVIAIAIIDHIFESDYDDDDDDREKTTVIVQHADGENNTFIGIQNNYDSDE